jgi:hypothetical protein
VFNLVESNIVPFYGQIAQGFNRANRWSVTDNHLSTLRTHLKTIAPEYGSKGNNVSCWFLSLSLIAAFGKETNRRSSFGNRVFRAESEPLHGTHDDDLHRNTKEFFRI